MKLRSVVLLFIGLFSFLNAAIAQTTVKQPFLTRTVTKLKDGMIMTSLKTPDGHEYRGVGSKETGKILFFLDGKSYDEDEVQQLDPTPYKDKQFGFGTPVDHEIAGRDLGAYSIILFVGEPPPASAFATNSLAAWKKYTGKTITGVVKGPAYSPYNKLLNGFILESGDETFQVDITASEVSRLMKAIIPGDIVIIQVGHATLRKGNPLPVITPKTLTKDGEKLIIRGSVQI